MTAGGSITIDDILTRHPDPIRRLTNDLRACIQQALPSATQHAYPGWHAIGFRDAHAGYVCGIFPFDDRVELVFERGARLEDPDRLLEQSDHKQIRRITFHPGQRIPRAGLRRLLLAALHHGTLRKAMRSPSKRLR